MQPEAGEAGVLLGDRRQQRLALGVGPERPAHLGQPVPGGDRVGGERQVPGDLGDRQLDGGSRSPNLIFGGLTRPACGAGSALLLARRRRLGRLARDRQRAPWRASGARSRTSARRSAARRRSGTGRLRSRPGPAGRAAGPASRRLARQPAGVGGCGARRRGAARSARDGGSTPARVPGCDRPRRRRRGRLGPPAGRAVDRPALRRGWPPGCDGALPVEPAARSAGAGRRPVEPPAALASAAARAGSVLAGATARPAARAGWRRPRRRSTRRRRGERRPAGAVGIGGSCAGLGAGRRPAPADRAGAVADRLAVGRRVRRCAGPVGGLLRGAADAAEEVEERRVDVGVGRRGPARAGAGRPRCAAGRDRPDCGAWKTPTAPCPGVVTSSVSAPVVVVEIRRRVVARSRTVTALSARRVGRTEEPGGVDRLMRRTSRPVRARRRRLIPAPPGSGSGWRRGGGRAARRPARGCGASR